MERLNQLLLEVWREACRHIEIEDSARKLTAIIAGHLPIERVTAFRLDPVRGLVERVGTDLPAVQPEAPARADYNPESFRRLVAACRHPRIIHHREHAPPTWLAPIAPAGRHDLLLGLLVSEGEPRGLLMLVAREGHVFGERHLGVAQALLEPFSAALENDRRLRETNALRAAAEADRQSLLTRLGRTDLAEELVGRESGLRDVMARVDLCARSDVPVLILGETGAGKEMIARAIRNRSARSSAPFVRVNCGAIPAGLIDSELFGHERGSFTGAVQARQGWFERADGGTLLLDEIGELPLEAQVRLLRVLQDGTFDRVGGHDPIKVDVRIVAATNRDLAAMVREGAFREDLWYRIAVFPIRVPALRERPEDIPELATHFARRAARRFGLPVHLPTKADIDQLLAYGWPGNIRELGAVIDRAAILGNGQRLEVGPALGVTAAPPVERIPGRSEHSSAAIMPSSPATLDWAMREHIQRALVATSGRIEGRHGAARLLDINPHTLRARMRKLGIEWKRFRAV